jgi:excisionase family DNA binding protein
MNPNNNFTPNPSGLFQITVDQDALKNLIHAITSAALAETETQQPQEPQFVSQQDLAKVLKLSVPTVIEMRKKGRIPAVQIGNKWRYEVSEVWEALRGSDQPFKGPKN